MISFQVPADHADDSEALQPPHDELRAERGHRVHGQAVLRAAQKAVHPADVWGRCAHPRQEQER